MPNTATGMDVSLSLGFETSFKTMPGSPSASKVPVTSPSIKPSRNKFQSNALTGSAQPNQVVWGKTGVDGSFGLECNKESLMPVLKGLFGSPLTTGTTGFQEHIYVLSTQMLPMFIEQTLASVSRYFLWNGVYVNSGSFNFQSEGLMEASVGVIGAKQSFNTSTAVTGTLTDLTGPLTFSYLLGRIKQNGTVVGWSRDITLDINRNGYKEMAIDESNEIAFIGFGKAAITGRISARFTDEASFLSAVDAAQSGVETSLEIFVPSGDGHGLMIVLPTIVFAPTSPVTQGTGQVTAELEFTAHARAATSNVAGGIRSKFHAAGNIALNTLTVELKVDGGTTQVVTFPTDATVDAAAAYIDTNTTGCVASVERANGETGGIIRIVSDTTGSASSVQILSSSTADTVLGFDNVVHSGFSNHAIVVYLMNGLAS